MRLAAFQRAGGVHMKVAAAAMAICPGMGDDK